MGDYLNHKELLTAMGSRGGDWDPTAPEWYMRLMESSDPVEKGMGWMQYHTIRYPRRTPYATSNDEIERILTLKDLTAFYNWTARYTQKVWHRMEAKGYVQKTEGKLWLRADFKVKYPIVREDGPADPIPIDPVERFVASQAPYIQAQLAKAQPAKLRTLADKAATLKTCFDEAHAEALAMLRTRFRPVEQSIYAECGVRLKTLPPRDEDKAQKWIQGELFPPEVLLANLPKSLSNGHDRPDTKPTPARQNAPPSPSSVVLNPNVTEAPADSATQGSVQPPSARAADPKPARPALSPAARAVVTQAQAIQAARQYPDPPVAIPVADLVSQPQPPAPTGGKADSGRAAPFVAAPEDARIPDAEFKQSVIAAFVDAGKPHPTPGQVRAVMEALPDHALARGAFLDSLRQSMPRIKYPGVLDSHTRGFVAAWPAMLDKLEAERAEAAKDAARQAERDRECAAECAAIEAKERRLREHPEECERCHGAGVFTQVIPRRGGKAEKWESTCGCPAAEGKVARGSLGYTKSEVA
jgi:hypothetical protein